MSDWEGVAGVLGLGCERVVRAIGGYACPIASFVSIDVPTLVIGCGGGHDIYASLPWYGWLTREQRALCTLANYSFTDDLDRYPSAVPKEDGDDAVVVRVDASSACTRKNAAYFPERELSIALGGTPVFAIRLFPNPMLADALSAFVTARGVKQIVVVDGGVDALLWAGERPYGSPYEDAQMMLACASVADPSRPSHPRRSAHQPVDGLAATQRDGGGSKDADPFWGVEADGVRLRFWVVGSALYVDEVDPAAFLRTWASPIGVRRERTVLADDAGFALYRNAVRALPADRASVIHESVVAAVSLADDSHGSERGPRGRHLQPRLYPHRIDDPTCMPDLHDETTCLWWADAAEWVRLSPFYRALVAHRPTYRIDSHVHADTKDAERTVAQSNMRAVEMGRLWNAATHVALRLTRTPVTPTVTPTDAQPPTDAQAQRPTEPQPQSPTEPQPARDRASSRAEEPSRTV